MRSDEKPVASVRPVQSTPIPMMPRQVSLGIPGSSTGVNFPVNYLQKAGVYVQRIVTTTGKSYRAGKCRYTLYNHFGLRTPNKLFKKLWYRSSSLFVQANCNGFG